MESITQPQVPYICTVSRSFTPGNGIKIYGAIQPEAQGFSINLQCSADIEAAADVALQVTVNILESNISLNSRRKGVWDKAQNIYSAWLQCKERFQFAIVCDFTHYKVSINGQHICEFPQRISYDRVTHLVIAGDIIIERISYEMEPTASSSHTDPLTTVPAPPPGFKYTDGPPPYSDVQPKGYLQNVNYGACPIPMHSPGIPPFGTGATFTPAIPGRKPYPIQEIYPSQSGTMIPLNTASSNFRPMPRSYFKKYIAYGCCIFFAVVIVLIGLLTVSSKKYYHHHYRVDQGHDRDY